MEHAVSESQMPKQKKKSIQNLVSLTSITLQKLPCVLDAYDEKYIWKLCRTRVK